MKSLAGLYQLHGDANPIAIVAYTSLEHILYPQLAADSRDIDTLVLEIKGR